MKTNTKKKKQNKQNKAGIRMELIPMKVPLDVGEMVHFACAYFNDEQLHIDMEIIGRDPILVDGNIVATTNGTAVSSSTVAQLGPTVRDTLSRFPWGGRRTLSVRIIRPVDVRRVTCRVTNVQGLVMGQLTAPLAQQLSFPGSFNKKNAEKEKKKKN